MFFGVIKTPPPKRLSTKFKIFLDILEKKKKTLTQRQIVIVDLSESMWNFALQVAVRAARQCKNTGYYINHEITN